MLPVGERFTALSANTKGNPQVSGFVALVPEARVKDERVVPEGTRILRLGTATSFRAARRWKW